MLKKKSTSSSNSETILLINNADFKSRLESQINEGVNLITQIDMAAGDRAFEQDYREWTDYNYEFLKQSFNNPTNSYVNTYDQAGYSFMGALGEVPGDPRKSLINQITYKLDNLKSLFKRADLIRSEVESQSEETVLRAVSFVNTSTEIFIVHGHDDAALANTARFLERLHLKPIILHEQSNSGRTIIEKIEAYTNVGFAIVLYTECDLGGKDANNLNPRARQNVVFEHGYLIGKIGRNNVCALVKGNVEKPSDISGVVYISMDEHEGWHNKVVKELKASGYNIDMNKL